MNFNKKIDEPVSTEMLLLQQLKEQSDVCNFTVKQGNWIKRHHDCVLYVSPFVKAMMRNNFDEKTKGFLDLKLGSPESIDMVMMFLYGESPNLTMDNISAVMHLAEFLLIPNLKAFCVNWINKETKVDEENVEKLLHLSNLFDFEMPTLTKYIRQHLPELLGGNQLLTITADTLENMFSDETLSYVTADVRFEFIMRWVAQSPAQRKPKLNEIIAGIELSEVTVNLIENARRDRLFQDLQTLYGTKHETLAKMQNVFITHAIYGKGVIWGFDLCKERWFKLRRSLPDFLKNAFTLTTHDSILCLVKNKKYKCVIRFHDFSVWGDVSCTSECCITSPGTLMTQFHSIYILDKVCYVVLDKKVIFRKSTTVQGLHNQAQRSHLMSKLQGPTNQTSDFGTPFSETRLTIFQGSVDECMKETSLKPLLSMNGTFEVQLVVNEIKSIAIFSTSQNCFCIYDQHSCKLQTIDIEVNNYDKVSPFKDGFVIYDQERICFIQSRTGLNNELLFSIDKTCLNDDNNYSYFRVVGNKWLRFNTTYNDLKDSYDDLMYYTLDELGKVNVNDAKWKQIPLPDLNVDESFIENFQEIKLPRSEIKCI